MRVLITGDSHTGALLRGKQLLENKNEWPQQVNLTIRPLGRSMINATPFFVDRGDHAEIRNEEYRKRFKRFPPANMEKINVIYGLSGPLHTSRVLRHQAWSEFVPAPFTTNESPVSNALLNQVIQNDCQHLLKFIDIILRIRKKLFVIEAPLPFKHAAKNIRPEVFTYVDSYYRNFIKQELKLRKVPLIAVDSECYDESGFMLECYRSPKENDMHHGNAEFGELMMKKILKFLLNEQKV